MLEFDVTEYNGYTITTYYYDTPENPLSWDAILGTVYTRNGNYGCEDIEDIVGDDGQLTAEVVEKNYCLPVYMYKHSGVAVSTAPFADSWDSGQIGWIILSKEKAAKEFPDNTEEKALETMRNTIKIWGDYLAGDVYGYIITDEDGDEVDSCWGYYGYEGFKCILKEAEDIIQSTVSNRAAEHERLIKAIEVILMAGTDEATPLVLSADRAWRAILYGADRNVMFVSNRIEGDVVYPESTPKTPDAVPLKVLRKMNKALDYINHKK